MSVPSQVCRAQILVGGATNQTASPLTSVPATGTFFSAQLNVPPWPLDWLPGADVYPYGSSSNVFIIDDRNWDYSASGNAMFAATAQPGGMGAMADGGVPQSPKSWTNSGISSAGTNMPLPKYGPNDLYWTNFAVSGPTNTMVIHPPSGVTNGVYNLLYTTSLSPPISWQWLMTTTPGQINLTVINATDPQRFYGLGATNSSAGTDFWFAFEALHPDLNSSYQLSLYVSSQTTNTATVTFPGLGFSTNFSLRPGAMTNIAIPNGAIISDWGDVITDGIHVVAAQPVSVYGLYYLATASAAFTAYPTPKLGTNYCLMSRPSLMPYPPYEYCFSQFAVLATENGTTVSIVPSATASLAAPYTNINLDQGYLYQINGVDVTGTLITSDKPIAVFAGADDAYVPTGITEAGNPLVQEQLPVTAWGNEVLALSFGRPGGDFYRVLAASS
ncbi:MAG: IgGFc-binding protein, partial [Limisphaerales bacterium]